MKSVIKRERIVCFDWYETEEHMWMCLADRNAICKVNKETKEVTILGRYPETEYTKEMLSFTIVRYMDKLVFLPHLADHIAVLNLVTEQITFIPIKKYDSVTLGKFATGLVKEEYIYMFGEWYPGILRMNMDSYEIDYYPYTDCVEGIGDAESYAGVGFVCTGKDIIMSAGKKGCVIKHDLEQNRGKVIKLSDREVSFFAVKQDGCNVWITEATGQEKKIYCWNLETNGVNEIPLMEPGLYNSPVIYKNCLYLFPMLAGKEILLLDLQNNTSCVQEELTNLLLPAGDIARVTAVRQQENIVKFQVGGSRCWYEYDMESHSLRETYYEICDAEFLNEWTKKKKTEIRNTKEFFWETKMFLTEYVKLLDGKERGESDGADSCGEKIYQALKKE